ncbi:hypothetical protein FOC1_g10015837, partial [Fusarium oxysporum f. sp. cubense race 1]
GLAWHLTPPKYGGSGFLASFQVLKAHLTSLYTPLPCPAIASFPSSEVSCKNTHPYPFRPSPLPALRFGLAHQTLFESPARKEKNDDTLGTPVLYYFAPLPQIPTSFRFPLCLCALHLILILILNLGFLLQIPPFPSWLLFLFAALLPSSTVSFKLPHPTLCSLIPTQNLT